MKMDRDDILRLLIDYREEERAIRNTKQNSLNIYLTLLVALASGSLILSQSLSDKIYVVMFLVTGIAIISISVIAYNHYKTNYLRQVECISVQAKLEQLLGMDKPDNYPLHSYWKNEALLPQNYIETRLAYSSSKKFIEKFFNHSDARFILILYMAFCIIGAAYIGYSLTMLLSC